jgi:hypothetical protein
VDYNLTKPPVGINQMAEAGVCFYSQLFKKIAGSLTVAEIPGGDQIRAFQGGGFVAEDGNTYVTFRIRLRVDPDYESNGKPLWNSIVHNVPAANAIPQGWGGV